MYYLTLLFLLCAMYWSRTEAAAAAVDYCSLTPEELLASGNKCIDLTLCNPGAMCSLRYAPTCGELSNNEL